MIDEIVTIPIGFDNYSYAVISGNEACIVDASEAGPVFEFLEKRRLTLKLILSTHHHGDHTGGNRELKKKTGCPVAGGDRRIAGIDIIVQENRPVTAGPFVIECNAVPGHTKGCSAWYLREAEALFTGDTLFYAGCGRLFEGTSGEMHRSLQKISTFPTTTKIYCGHEYTVDNLLFARTIEPDNDFITGRLSTIRTLLSRGKPSGPALLSTECATNPFLRTGEASVRVALNGEKASDEEIFAELRHRKDRF